MKRFSRFLSVAVGLAIGLHGVAPVAADAPREAAAAAAEAARLAPDDAAVHDRSARAHAAIGEIETALAAARRAVELAPDDAAYLRGLAQLASWNGDYQTAHRSWQHLLELRPDDREASLGLARTAAWSGRTDAAARLYRRHVERYPDDGDARLEYARATAWQGNAAAALEILETYRRDFGPSERYDEDRAMALTAAARGAAAVEILAPLVAADPANPRRQRLYTMALAEDHRPAQALDYLGSARQLEPESPETQEAARVVATPLRSTLRPLFELYNDSDSVDVARAGIEGSFALTLRSRLALGVTREELRADVASGLGAPGGRDVRADGAWLGLSHRFSPRVRADARLGQAEVEGGAELTTYGLTLSLEPSDVLDLTLERYRGFYAVSPRALDLGIHRTGNQLRLDWNPGPRYWLEANAAYDQLADGNRRWDLSLAPRRQVLRRQRFNLDLGLRAWWFGFDTDPGNGYYAPSSYQRYAATAFGYWKLSGQNGLGMVLGLGWFKDDATSAYRFGGDLALEATFGIYRDWMLVVRAGVTENSRLQSGAFNAYGGHLALTRRFGRPRPSYDARPAPPPAAPAPAVAVAAATEAPAIESVVESPAPAPEAKTAVVITPAPEPPAQREAAVVITPAPEPPAQREAAVVITPAPEPVAANTPVADAGVGRTIFELQLGLFHHRANALDFVTELGALGFRSYLVEVLSSRGETRYTVRIGPYDSMDEAGVRAARIRDDLQLDSVIRYRSVVP